MLGNDLQRTTLTDGIIRCNFVDALKVNTHTVTEGFGQHCEEAQTVLNHHFSHIH